MKAKPTESSERLIRPCAVCGTFYPGERVSLNSALDKLLDAVRPQPGPPVLGAIAPHAGYAYSGPTAASVYGRLRGASYDAVVIVSPSHREFFDGVSVYGGEGYATPLGIVAVDSSLREKLIDECAVVRSSSAGHVSEHAVEVHLPFLQKVLGDFRFVPLVIGHQSAATCFALGVALGSVLKGLRALLVASTDLSHFYPATVAHRMDEIVINDLRAFDEEKLMGHLESGAAEACGGGPTVAVLTALKRLGSSRIDVLKYATSGDMTGDQDSVVGYVGAIAI
jgi:AmmeMemoRadiSam system protein B